MERNQEHGLSFRVGVHAGPAIGGVVGRLQPRFCIFGDTMNTASRMESTSEAGKIQISEAVKGLLPEGAFAFTDRGERDVKGKGMMRTFFVDGLLCPPELLADQGRADSFGELQSPRRDRSQTMEARAGAKVLEFLPQLHQIQSSLDELVALKQALATVPLTECSIHATGLLSFLEHQKKEKERKAAPGAAGGGAGPAEKRKLT